MLYLKSENNYIIRLDKGEEIVTSISELCKKENIKAGIVNGIGAANSIDVGIFDNTSKKFLCHRYEGEYEISSLSGNISIMNNEPYLHLHITIGNPEKNIVVAGHLNRCIISTTAEIFISSLNANINRFFSDDIGLNLIKFQ